MVDWHGFLILALDITKQNYFNITQMTQRDLLAFRQSGKTVSQKLADCWRGNIVISLQIIC
jgi:hypothetical protein